MPQKLGVRETTSEIEDNISNREQIECGGCATMFWHYCGMSNIKLVSGSQNYHIIVGSSLQICGYTQKEPQSMSLAH